MSSTITKQLSFLDYQYGDAPKLCEVIRAMRIKNKLNERNIYSAPFLRDDGSILLVVSIENDTIEINCTTRKTFEIYRESDAAEIVYTDENELLNSIPSLRNY